MPRILAVCIAVAFMPALASAAEKKPKLGDIDGVYYTDVASDREACHQAVRNKIALCRENTSFVSNTEDRKYPGCLPIFEEQAMSCVDHFRSEAYKCDGSGSARIEDFTGFACMVTETSVEESSDVTETVGEGETCKIEISGRMFDWDGPCIDGRVTGVGTVSGHGWIGHGPARDGKIHGRHTARHTDGTTFEGVYENGTLVHGTLTDPDGAVTSIP